MFKITIEETRERKRTIGGQWAVVDTKEVDRDGQFIQSGDPKTRIKDVYGYTPQIESTVTETAKVFEQSVEHLNVAVVIKAINNLE